jgi:hypothetical protein
MTYARFELFLFLREGRRIWEGCGSFFRIIEPLAGAMYKVRVSIFDVIQTHELLISS